MRAPGPRPRRRAIFTPLIFFSNYSKNMLKNKFKNISGSGEIVCIARLYMQKRNQIGCRANKNQNIFGRNAKVRGPGAGASGRGLRGPSDLNRG